MPSLFWIVGSAALGVVFGACLTVLISRLPRDGPVWHPLPRFEECAGELAVHDRVPLLSWLWLRGTCRWCGQPINVRYPAVELAGGLAGLGVLVVYHACSPSHGLGFVLAVAFFAVASLAIVPIELEHGVIPDQITVTGVLSGAALSFLAGGLTPMQSLLGMVVGFGVICLLAGVGKAVWHAEAVGGGVVKLGAMVGALLGWKIAVSAVLITITLVILAALALIPWCALRRRPRPQYLEVGPLLCAAVAPALLYHEGTAFWVVRGLGLWFRP